MKLPVFFHIPKNAGTYISSMTLPCLRQYITESGIDIWEWYHLDVRRDNTTYYRIIGYRGSRDLNDSYVRQPGLGNHRISFYNVDIKDLNFEDFIPFALTVVDMGFTNYREDIYNILPSEIKPYEFMCLREPYSRIQSLYSYIQSNQSNHEPTNSAYESLSFIEYLNSSLLEGGWLIKRLLGLVDQTPIEQTHFERVCQILDNILICYLDDLFSCICKVYKGCYNIDVSANLISGEGACYNKTYNKVNVPFDSLDDKTRSTFLNQTKWDRKIYNTYSNANIPST
tara:strand:- start:2583 stop:3434 length:852 start_codon:yes stop_codon:yes gene_type:complete